MARLEHVAQRAAAELGRQQGQECCDVRGIEAFLGRAAS